MPKTTAEKIATKREQIQQLKNEEKQLIQKQKQQDRKDRTKRLCSRHGLLESMLPEIASITDEQYKSLIKKAVDNEFFQQLLNGMTAMAEDIVALDKEQSAHGSNATKPSTGATPNTTNTIPKPMQTATPSNAALSAKADGGATVEG